MVEIWQCPTYNHLREQRRLMRGAEGAEKLAEMVEHRETCELCKAETLALAALPHSERAPAQGGRGEAGA